MLRRLRAVATTAFFWALVWLPMGIVLGLIGNVGPRSDLMPPPIVWFATAWMVWGAVSGAVFAVLLSVAESGRTPATLSLFRSGLWGAVGCMTVPAAVTIIDLFRGPWSVRSYDWSLTALVLALRALLGGVCAAGTVALVRREPSGSR